MVRKPSEKLIEWLEQQLREAAPGTRLPTDAQLGETFGVSEITVRRALKGYRDRDLVSRIRGRGTFVAGAVEPAAKVMRPRESSAQNIAEHILRSIHSGQLRRGQALPPVKQVVHRFRVSPASVRLAYSLLEEQGHVTRVGRTYWLGGFTETLTPERVRDVLLVKHGASDLTGIFKEDELGQAYQKMERELLANGFVLQFATTAQMKRLLRGWRLGRGLPHGFVFYRLDEKKYETVRPWIQQILRFADRANRPTPAVLIDWSMGALRPRVRGSQVLSRGNLSTIVARALAQRLVGGRHRGVVVFSGPNAYRVAQIGKIRAELKHLDPQFGFRLALLDRTAKNAAQELPRAYQAGIRNTRWLRQILSKYEPTPKSVIAAETLQVSDYDTLYERLPEKRVWICFEDRRAADILEWARTKDIRVPRELALITLRNQAEFLHLGLSCCRPDWEQIGYQMAHALIGDFPVEKTSKGYIRTHAFVVDRLTTQRTTWQPVATLA